MFGPIEQNATVPRTTPRRGQGGMTLIELLVVLTILAILSAAAVVSTESVVSQGRFEATQQTMGSIEKAVLGPDLMQSSDGTLATAGFVADVGRLPLAINAGGGLLPSELWWNPSDLPAFGFQQATAERVGSADADAEVVVPCGWRGPYLRLPIGADNVSDGWGGQFLLLDKDGNPAAAGEEIAAIQSLGSNGVPGSVAGEAYTRDDALVFASATENRYQATIAVTVWQRDADGNLEPPGGSGDLVVRLFGPEQGSVGVTVASTSLDTPLLAPPVFQFAAVPIGPHVLRAYEEHAGNVRVRSSTPLEIQVHPQGPASWRLILPANETP